MNKWLTHIVPAFVAVIPALVTAGTLSTAWIGTTPGSEEPDMEAMVLTLLDYDASSCTTNCELSPCTGPGVHLNESTPYGNDGGELHDCVGDAGCSVHQCDPTFTLAPDDLRTLIQMIPSIPANTLADYRSDRGQPAPESGQTGRSDHGLRGLGSGLGGVDSNPTA